MSLAPEHHQAIEAEIAERSGPSRAFFLLMVLSTTIAAYGLLSNSTATVIGAMLVAPLMGPILGLALGLAKGRTDLFARALRAEAMGIAVSIAVSIAVALMAGPENIDYLQSEIAARTRPTLYDLAIGVAAGLAGAYATVNPRVSDSIAGVAIAVALVPPLAVCGLCSAGALAGGEHLWASAVGSFMLFLANFLTIELAAAGLYLFYGLGHWREIFRSRGLVRGLGVQLVLLLTTLVFLASQLNALLESRSLERQARRVATRELAGHPGVALDSLEVRPLGPALAVNLVVRAPREVDPGVVEGLQRRLTRALGREVELGLGTILATYYTSEGRRYTLPAPAPDPVEIRRRELSRSLEAALRSFPSVELDSFGQQEDGGLLVTLRSPYEFDDALVARLEEVARREHGGEFPALTVRTLMSRDWTSLGPAPPVEPGLAFQAQLRARVRMALEEVVGADSLVLELEVRPGEVPEGDAPLPTPVSGDLQGRPLEVQAVIRTRRPITSAEATAWEGFLGERLEAPVRLTVDNRLGQTVRPQAAAGSGP